MFTEFCAEASLRALLRPGLPYPTGMERRAWTALPDCEAILRGACEARSMPYPLVTATSFLAYVRTGEREIFQRPYFERRHHLIRTAVGECVQWTGAFLDDVIDGLWLIAEETSWVVSAHNVDPHPGRVDAADRPLPDGQNPVIDLFAAQTAATITLCCHLLADPLDGVTPMIRRRMGQEVEARILRPFMQRDDFWWMGMIRKDVNNWTPWILSNILTCMLYWERDPYRLAQGVRRAMEMLDRYLDVMPEDGGCDEGAGYWNMSGASLLDCLELLRHASGGKIDLYHQPKIRNIARFPAVAHVAGPYFWNFADCDLKPFLDGERLWRFGQRVGEPSLQKLGAACLAENPGPWPRDTPQFSRVLDRLLGSASRVQAGQPEGAQGVRILQDLQVWACRRGRYYAAIKAGHNGENHNHNDVGSFLFYIDGEPAMIDAGNMTYTAKTFSDQRYTLWNTRSVNHNVAIIAGMEQCAGRGHAACGVRMDEDGMAMELQHAYPAQCGLGRYERRGSLDREGLCIEDIIALERPAQVQWVFMLKQRPCLEPGVCVAGALTLRFAPQLRYEAQACPVTDVRMARNFPGEIWRLVLTAESQTQHAALFRMEGNL